MWRRRCRGGPGAAVVALVVAGMAGCSGGAAYVPARTATASAPPASSALGRYQPIWPFADAGEAAGWQRRYRLSGLQPWRLSADQTALAFVRYLGFERIDRVTGRTAGAGEARVSVGGHGVRSAAQIHLVRLGTGRDAPWEVVGAAAKELTITTPAYGTAVSSPLTVGGSAAEGVAGVRVEVRQRSVASPLGTYCCARAGGGGGRWAATVPLRGAADPVATIVASTGGRAAAAEHFTVTAVRVVR
jgi:hypothetical protein